MGESNRWNNYAISTADLATSLTKSSGSLVAANGTLEEAVALTATANTIIQDADVVGTALKTVAMRLRGTSTEEMEEEGLDTDGVVTSKSKLQSKVKSLSGVDILTDTGAYKSTYQILSEIANVWEDINDMDQAALLELLAGKRAGSIMSAILQNPETLKDAFESANNAAGSAIAENEKYLDSIQGRIDLFNNAIQTMWNNTLDDDVVKFFIDVGTFLIKAVDNLGLIKTLVMGIGTYLIKKHFKGDLFGGLFGDTTSIKSIKKQIADLEATYTRAKEKFDHSKSTKDREAMENAEKNLNAFKESKQPILDADAKKTSLNEQLEKLKTEREQLQSDLQIAQDDLVNITTNGIQEDLRDYVEVDTSHIDNEIAGVQEKLNLAKQQLTDAKSRTWDDYKALGSITPAKDKNIRIDEKTQEVKLLEEELNNLQVKKDEFMSSEINNIVSEGAKSQVEDLTNKIDEVDKTILQTESDLKKTEIELETLGNSGITVGQKIKTGFKTASQSVLKFGKEMLKSMGYMFIITTTIELVGMGISKLIEIISDAGESFENLQDKFEKARSEVESVKSEITNLESELETTNKQIEELLELDTLTFVEQEELNRLKSVSDELRSQIELKQQLQGSLQKGANDATILAADKYMDTSFANEKSRTEVEEEGAETGGFWGKLAGIGIAIGSLALAPFTGGWSLAAMPLAFGAESIGESIGSASAGSGYDAEESVSEAIHNMNAQRDELIKARDEALAAYVDGSGTEEAYNSAEQELTEYNSNLAKSITQISEYRNAIMSDVENATPEQLEKAKAWGDIIDAYNIEMGGEGAKESAINRVFSDGATLGKFEKEKKSIDDYVEALKNGDKSAAQSIADLINNNEALKNAFSAKTLDPQDAIDYFTKIGQAANFATIEGKTEEIRKATEKLGSAFSNTDQFMDGDKVNTTAIAEYFQGTSEATRKEIARLVKNIHEGEISVQQAMKSFAAFGMLESWKIIETEVAELNTEVFKDLEDDISGIINTVKELSAAFESVASSIDLVSQAEAEMAYSGHLSVETALQLMESTDDWNKVLKIEEGNIKLVDGAEQVLVQTKLDLIKKNLQTALSTVEAQLAQITATESSDNLATTIEESTNLAVTQLAGNMAYLTEMMTAYTKAAAGEYVDMSAVTKSAKEAKNKVLSDTNYKKNAAEAIGREELEKEKARLETMLGMYETVDTPSEFKNNYSSDKVSGGSSTKKEAMEDKFQKAMDYWENRISANQARYEQLQNEIDLLESQGKKAGVEYYEEQIGLENKRLKLLEAQKTEAKNFLGTFKEGSDEWWEVANTLNDLESEIDDVTSSIQNLRDAMAEINWYVFDETHERYSSLIDDLNTIRDLISPNGEEDWFDDEGMWTEKGVASLATYIQQLTMYENALDEVSDKLEDDYSLSYAGNEKHYKDLGIDSEQELYDAREKLIDQQYDYAKAVSDSKQSVVDMYESQIDAIEEWSDKAIEAYNDYIDVVKEALDAERDLYEFKKDVEKQTKDIAALERRIASLSGSNSAADIAERRKLEADLYEAREGLNDTYYDHAKDSQNQALDDEVEAYEKSMTNYIDTLREKLDEAKLNMDLFMEQVTTAVTMNANTVLTQYTNTGIAIDKTLTEPWQKAANAMKGYETNTLPLMNNWTKEGGVFYNFKTNATNQLTSPWTAGKNALTSFQNDVKVKMADVVNKVKSNVVNAAGQLSSLYQQIKDTEKRAKDAATTITNTIDHANEKINNMAKQSTATATVQANGKTFSKKVTVQGNTTDAKQKAMSALQSEVVSYMSNTHMSTDRAASMWDQTWAKKVKFSDVKMLAKGSRSTANDAFAITDESWIGEEITLAAGKNGQLQYLKKGSAVMPADISSNLIEWGKLDPNMMNIGGTPNFNMISNAVNKPEFNLTFDALVKADRIDEGTLPEIKKYVTQEINSLVKQMNYAIKGYSR